MTGCVTKAHKSHGCGGEREPQLSISHFLRNTYSNRHHHHPTYIPWILTRRARVAGDSHSVSVTRERSKTSQRVRIVDKAVIVPHSQTLDFSIPQPTSYRPSSSTRQATTSPPETRVGVSSCLSGMRWCAAIRLVCLT